MVTLERNHKLHAPLKELSRKSYPIDFKENDLLARFLLSVCTTKIKKGACTKKTRAVASHRGNVASSGVTDNKKKKK